MSRRRRKTDRKPSPAPVARVRGSVPQWRTRGWWIGIGAAALLLAATTIGQVVFERYTNKALDGALHLLKRPTPAGTAAGSLVVHSKWPFGRCPTQVPAVLPGGPAVDDVKITKSLEQDLFEKGAPVLGDGTLTLDLSALGDDTVQITDLRLVIFKREKLAPLWTLEPGGTCGDTYERRFFVDLNKETVKDAGLMGGRPEVDGTPRADPLGPTFHVSERDPARIVVYSYACDGYVEWGLELEYIENGTRKVYPIASAAQPLRSTGGQSVPVFGISDDQSKLVPRGHEAKTDCLPAGSAPA